MKSYAETLTETLEIVLSNYYDFLKIYFKTHLKYVSKCFIYCELIKSFIRNNMVNLF